MNKDKDPTTALELIQALKRITFKRISGGGFRCRKCHQRVNRGKTQSHAKAHMREMLRHQPWINKPQAKKERPRARWVDGSFVCPQCNKRQYYGHLSSVARWVCAYCYTGVEIYR